MKLFIASLFFLVSSLTYGQCVDSDQQFADRIAQKNEDLRQRGIISEREYQFGKLMILDMGLCSGSLDLASFCRQKEELIEALKVKPNPETEPTTASRALNSLEQNSSVLRHLIEMRSKCVL